MPTELASKNILRDSQRINVIHKHSAADTSKLHQHRLTPREREVLRLVLKGYSSAEAAEALFCSKRTVDFHLYRAYSKLEVKNRVQAMQRAVELGIIKL